MTQVVLRMMLSMDESEYQSEASCLEYHCSVHPRPSKGIVRGMLPMATEDQVPTSQEALFLYKRSLQSSGTFRPGLITNINILALSLQGITHGAHGLPP